MELEFHYYITGILARRAGFSEEDATIIAHSSQLVDDNDTLRTVEDASTGSLYEMYISQTMNILKPKNELMRIYPIFHFLPGQPAAPSAQRPDGKMHILTTTPDSELARKVMAAPRQEPAPFRLHRLGVAAHCFADSWAHQNFVGWKDGINGQDLNMLPNIGHADFIHHPDWVGHRWDDPRILSANSQINNNHRFLDAAKRLYEEFSFYTDNNAQAGWPQLQQDLLQAMGPVYTGNKQYGLDERMKAYAGLFNLPDYKPNSWFDEAVTTEVRGLPDTFMPTLTIFTDKYSWKDGWQTSHWYRFQEAVKAHQAFCMSELELLFKQMEVNLHDH